jgi:hypothetical protein
MEGTFYNIRGEVTNLLRFYDNNIVLGVWIQGNTIEDISLVLKWFNINNPKAHRSKGHYEIIDNSLQFEVESEEGVVVFNGKLLNPSTLRLKYESLIIGFRSIDTYTSVSSNSIVDKRSRFNSKLSDFVHYHFSRYIYKLISRKLTRNLLYFYHITGGGIIECFNCGYNEEITALFHGFGNNPWSNLGYQCQSCGKFLEVKSRWNNNPHASICECGGLMSREEPIFCPKCRSNQVKYSCIILT